MIKRHSSQEVDRLLEDKSIDARTKIKNKTILESAVAVNVVTVTADFTATADDNIIVVDASSNSVTVTLPTAVGMEGLMYTIKCVDDTNTVTVSGSETIDGETSQTLNQWDGMKIISNNDVWLII